MVLKTQIKNNSNTTRNLRWAGVKGVSIAPNETVMLEGAYPTACRNQACISQFMHEFSSKLIDVVLVTDLPVNTPDNVVVSQPERAPAVQEKPVVRTETIIETTSLDKSEAFSREEITSKPVALDPYSNTEISERLFVSQAPSEYTDEGGLVKNMGPMERFMMNRTIRITDDVGDKTPTISETAQVAAKPMFKDAADAPKAENSPANNVFRKNETASLEQLGAVVGEASEESENVTLEKRKGARKSRKGTVAPTE